MSSENNSGGVNIFDGKQITQRVTEGVTASVTNTAMGFFTGLLATATDMAFWVAIIAIPLLFTEWGQKLLRGVVGDDMFGNIMGYRDSAMAALGSTAIGRGLDSLLNAVGLGTPLQDAAKNYVRTITQEQFAQQTGLARAASDILYPHREELLRRGITNAQEALKPEHITFLLQTLPTDKLTTLLTTLRTSGTPEQQQQYRQAIDTLLQNPDVLRELNTRHPSLIGRITAEVLQGGTTGPVDLHRIRQLVATPEGLQTLATAIPSIPAATLTSLGLTQAQLQSAVADMQANNPRGQAYRTLINSEALPVLGPVLQRLQGAPSLTTAVEGLRSPQVREQLGNPAIIDALAQVAPQNPTTRALFTSVRNADGTVTYPNIQAAQTFAAHLDSGNEQQRAQRGAAIGAVDKILSTGQLPAAGSPERAALHTFLGDESNRNALRDFIRTADTSTLSNEQNRLVTLLRSEQHGEKLLRVFSDAEAVKWIEEQQKPRTQSQNPSLLDRFTGAVQDYATSKLPTAAAIQLSNAPDIVKENAEAIVALREAMPAATTTTQQPASAPAPAQTSSIDADPGIAQQVAAASAGARSAGISNATTTIGTNVAALASLPPPPRENTAILAG